MNTIVDNGSIYRQAPEIEEDEEQYRLLVGDYLR